jgi:proprotein convertase subtilisin/kexin type 5
LNCDGPNVNNCSECLSNSQLTDNKTCECLINFYWTGTQCESCHPTCLTCSASESNNCESCDEESYRSLNSIKQCECIEGYFDLNNECL